MTHERMYLLVWLDKKQDGKLYVYPQNRGRNY
jgi:hypothetical protein